MQWQQWVLIIWYALNGHLDGRRRPSRPHPVIAYRWHRASTALWPALVTPAVSGGAV